MQPLEKRVSLLKKDIDTAYSQLAIDDKRTQLTQLESELARPEIWNNPGAAQEKSKQQAAIAAMVEPWETLRAQTADIIELMDLGDESLLNEFEGQVDALEKEFLGRKKEL